MPLSASESRVAAGGGLSRLGERTDYDSIASSYDRSQTLQPDALQEWRLALSEVLAPTSSGPLLHLGTGTTIWSVLLGDWFNLDVVSVEPSPSTASSPGGGIISARSDDFQGAT
jgi:hypothetical protein